MRIPLRFADECGELLVAHESAESRIPRFDRYCFGNVEGYFPDVLHVRKQQALVALFLRDHGAERFARGEKHLARDLRCFAYESAKPYAREDVHVVALRDEDLFSFIIDGLKWTARSHETLSVRCLRHVLRQAFGFRRWIRERENNRLFRVHCHLFEDFIREGTRRCRDAELMFFIRVST